MSHPWSLVGVEAPGVVEDKAHILREVLRGGVLAAAQFQPHCAQVHGGFDDGEVILEQAKHIFIGIFSCLLPDFHRKSEDLHWE